MKTNVYIVCILTSDAIGKTNNLLDNLRKNNTKHISWIENILEEVYY